MGKKKKKWSRKGKRWKDFWRGGKGSEEIGNEEEGRNEVTILGFGGSTAGAAKQ